MVLANKAIMPTQSLAINPTPALTCVADNGPGSLVASPLTSSRLTGQAHTPIHTRTPHSIAKQLCRLELLSPSLYPGVAAMWRSLEETRAQLTRKYLEVLAAPEGVCIVEAQSGKHTYARAQCDRTIFDGKKTFGLGRAKSSAHRAYQQRIEKRDALVELGRFEDLARAAVAGAIALADSVDLKSGEATAIEQPSKKLRALSFFTGCMGLDLGVEQAGFEVIAACELPTSLRVPHQAKSRAADTIKLNRPELPVYEGIESYDFPAEHFGIDLVFGGPPCQSWSIAGKRLGSADARGQLLQKYADVIARLKPKTFILENVPGLASFEGGKVLRELVEFFEAAAYFVRTEIVDAFDFGVAQHRKRLLLVGSLIAMPEPLKGERKHTTLREAFAKLNQVEPEALPLAPCVLAAMEENPSLRLSWNKPATTMRTKPGTDRRSPYAHPDKNRTISVAEGMRLQGFPDNWQLAGSVRDKFLQLGNAVPVPLACAAAMSAKQTITETENKEPAEEMPPTPFNPATLQGAIAPSAPEQIVAAQPAVSEAVFPSLPSAVLVPRTFAKGWLNELPDPTYGNVLELMRGIHTQSDAHLAAHQKAQPDYGVTAVGNADMEDLVRGEGLAVFLGELSKGLATAEAMEKAKEMASLIVRKFNRNGYKARVSFGGANSLMLPEKLGHSFLDGALNTFLVRAGLAQHDYETSGFIRPIEKDFESAVSELPTATEPAAAKTDCKKEPAIATKLNTVAITDASVKLDRDFGLICNPAETRWQWQDLQDSDEPIDGQVYPSRELATCAAIETLKARKTVSQNTGYGPVNETIEQWVESAFPDGLPVEILRPSKEIALINCLERCDATRTPPTVHGIRKFWEKHHNRKITPKPIRNTLSALLETGDVAEVPNKKDEWQLTPLYARRLAAYELSLQPEIKTALHISIEQGCLPGRTATLYTFQPTLAGVKAAIALSKSAKFSKLLCEILTEEQAANFKPQIMSYSERAATSYRKPARTPRKLTGPKEKPTGMGEAAFRAEWSVYLEHGKIALEQRDGWWILDIEGHGQSTSKDLGLLSMCLENIEMQLTGKSAAALKWQRDAARKAAANPDARRIREGIAKKEALAASWAEAQASGAA